MESLNTLQQKTNETLSLFRQGFGAGIKEKKSTKTKMVLCGMGGSILGAELFKTYAQKQGLDLDITIWQSYGLPPHTQNAHTHVSCLSYSGNTEETISAFMAARKKHMRITCMAREGILARRAQLTKTPLRIMPDTVVPRLVAPYVFGFFVGLYTPKAAIPASLAATPVQAHALAARLAKKQILVYTPVSWISLAHLWEIHLNETAGMLAFGDDIPDIDHHTLAALKNIKQKTSFGALFLQNASQFPLMRERIALTKQTIRALGITTTSLSFSETNTIQTILSHARSASSTSLLLARSAHFNPFSNTIQESFKKKLRARI